MCYNKHMSNTEARVTKLPKRAFTKPSIVAVVFFIIILLILIPNTIALYTNKASVQGIYLIILSPLVLPGLFCAFHTGLAIGKISYTKWHKGLPVSIFVLIIMQIICITLCIGIEITLAGYPIKMCFDICQKVEMIDTIASYSLFSTMLFLPAYYALWRYYSWHNK